MWDNGWSAGSGDLFRVTAFRQAIACGIDKEGLIADVYRGTTEPYFTWQPRWSRWYPDTGEVPTLEVAQRVVATRSGHNFHQFNR